MDHPFSNIKCLKIAGIRCRLDRSWYRCLGILTKLGIPCTSRGGDFLKSIRSHYSSCGLLELPPLVVEYFAGFVTRRGFRIPDANPHGMNVLGIEGRRAILKQFQTAPPGIANHGYIQVAFSYYAERFVLDVRTGEVMVCRSPMLSHELYEWDKAGRNEDVGQAVRRCADETFKNLAMMFWCFENFSDDDDDEADPE